MRFLASWWPLLTMAVRLVLFSLLALLSFSVGRLYLGWVFFGYVLVEFVMLGVNRLRR